MEKSGKIEDGVMDNLLQGFIKRQMQPDSTCEAFDPDLASAYLERVMTEREQSHYESHLSECAPCRKNVIALARLVEAEVTEVSVAAVAAGVPASLNEATAEANHFASEEKAHWLGKLKGWFGLLATPRFALAATAALALAVAIPYVLIQNSQMSQRDMTSALDAKEDGKAAAQAAKNNPPPSTTPNTSPNNPVNGDTPQSTANKQQAESKSSTPAPGAPATAAEPEAGASGAGNAPAKEEAVEGEKAKREEAAKPTDTVTSTTAQPPEAAKSQPATAKSDEPGRIDTKDAQRIENDKDNASPSTTLKPGNNAGGASRRNAPTVGPDSPKPAPSPGRTSDSPPRSIAAKRFSEASESNRERSNASASRRVGKKTFWLVDDTWTDENYRSDKEMPIVPLIKDSENYKNILEKYSDLKKFFSAFGANERAIIVRKDMAYKLIPQDANK